MYRIYVKLQNEAFGHVFKSHSSIKDDKVAILPFIGFVTEGYISEEEWAKSQQSICDKLNLYVSETTIDGRSKLARSIRNFSWKDIFNMRKSRSDFKPCGYKTISNISSMQIQISNCGSMVRCKKENERVSSWHEIYFEADGEPYFIDSKQKYYLSEFTKF